MSAGAPRTPICGSLHQHRAGLAFDERCPECKRLLDDASAILARNTALRPPPSSLAVASADLRHAAGELGRLTLEAARRQAIAIGRALRR
jgi:hypothetical protein